ncbi:MAG: hypothetical protein ACR2G7_12585 [Acidimicrobiales bacterium]
MARSEQSRAMGQDDAITERFPSLFRPPLGFACPWERADAEDDALARLAGALDSGATGLAGHLHLTADGVPVLHPEPQVRVGLRRRRLAQLTRAQVPNDVPSLGQLYQRCGSRFELALSVDDMAAATAAVAVASEAGGDAVGRLWLCCPDWRQAAAWRVAASPDVRLVDVTRLRGMDEGPERRAAALAGADIDAVSLPEGDWSAGLTTLFHRFGRLAFVAGPASHRRQLDAVLALGVDAVTSDHPERMVDALADLASTAS